MHTLSFILPNKHAFVSIPGTDANTTYLPPFSPVFESDFAGKRDQLDENCLDIFLVYFCMGRHGCELFLQLRQRSAEKRALLEAWWAARHNSWREYGV